MLAKLPPVSNASHEASILIALEAAGIEPIVQPAPFDSNGIPTYSHIMVDEADYDRALAAIEDLQVTPAITADSATSTVFLNAIISAVAILLGGLVYQWFTRG